MEEITIILDLCHHLWHHTSTLKAESLHTTANDGGAVGDGYDWLISQLSSITLEYIPSVCVSVIFFSNKIVSCELLNITFFVNNSFLFFKVGKQHKTTDCTSVTEHD